MLSMKLQCPPGQVPTLRVPVRAELHWAQKDRETLSFEVAILGHSREE
jgi:hypothetical protein